MELGENVCRVQISGASPLCLNTALGGERKGVYLWVMIPGVNEI